MPAGEGYVLDLARSVRDTYRAAEDELLAVVAQETAKATEGRPDRGSRVLEEALAVSRIRAVAERVAARLDGSVEGLVGETLEKAWARGEAEALRELKALGSRAASRSVSTTARLTVLQALARALIDTLRAVHSSILRQTADAYRAAVAAATLPLAAGARPRRVDAAKAALRDLADRGVVDFTDKAGRRWELATYTEMATRSAGARALVEGHTDSLTARGYTFVIVSDHRQECALCRPWEGRVLRILAGEIGEVSVKSMTGPEMLTIDVAGTLAEARAAGFQHPNCRHNVRAYLPGATKVKSTEAMADPEGEQARDRHRALERNVRKWKRRLVAAEAAGDRAEIAHSKAKVRAWQAAIRQHVEATGLNRLPNRERVGVAR